MSECKLLDKWAQVCSHVYKNISISLKHSPLFIHHSSWELFLDQLYLPPLLMNSLWSNPLPCMAACTPMSRIDLVGSFLPWELSRKRMYSSSRRYELRIALLDSGTKHFMCLWVFRKCWNWSSVTTWSVASRILLLSMSPQFSPSFRNI